MLKEKDDAFGREILDYFNGENAIEIVETETGFIGPSSGPASYFTEFKDWRSHEKKAIKHVKGRVLDVGAGAGRVSLHLQRKGHDVVAIDNSPLAIEVCKKRGVKDARVMKATQVNSGMGVFDTIAMFGNNFGLMESFERAKWLLKRFHGITSGDARIIAESNDPYMSKRQEHVEYHKYNRERGRMGGQLRLRIRYRDYKTPWFDYLIVSKKEMEEILDGTGWYLERTYDHPKMTWYMAVIGKD